MTTAIEVKERPILFSGEMVKAILSGRKTQTRRVVKPPLPQWTQSVFYDPEHEAWFESSCTGNAALQDGDAALVGCPFRIGMTLWVRERWCVTGDAALDYPSVNYFEPRASRNLRSWESEFRFEDSYNTFACWRDDLVTIFARCNKAGWLPSIHMPRWASRITLEITEVRVERLQDIDWTDAIAEGMTDPNRAAVRIDRTNPKAPVSQFCRLWESINGKKHPWESNPWVWVLGFKKL